VEKLPDNCAGWHLETVREHRGKGMSIVGSRYQRIAKYMAEWEELVRAAINCGLYRSVSCYYYLYLRAVRVQKTWLPIDTPFLVSQIRDSISKLRGLSPLANYTDTATIAFRQS
jgi:hypothetical protein